MAHLGHASLLFDSGVTRVLFDPVLGLDHHEGLYSVWPERTLNLRRFPDVHAIVISHRHADHFDPPSLSCFPRETPVLIPDDQLLLEAIAEMGFERVIIAQSMVKVQIGDLELTPTPAAPGANENGYIVEHGNTKIWNLIDTVPLPGDVAMVNALVGLFDLAVVPWQPLIDVLHAGKGVQFPIAHYKRLLENALQINARQLALGACGFRATPGYSYLNDYIFPVSASRFVSDLRAAGGRRVGSVLSPVAGDVVELRQEATLHRQALAYCRSQAQGASYNWDPFGRQLRSRSSLGTASTRHAAVQRLAAFFGTELPKFIERHREEFHYHRLRASVFQYVVNCGSGSDSWFVSFVRGTPRIRQGSYRQPPTTLVSVTADALVGLLDHKRSWSHVVQSADYIAMPMGYRVLGCEIVAVDDAVDPVKMLFAGDDHAARVVRAMLPVLGT